MLLFETGVGGFFTSPSLSNGPCKRYAGERQKWLKGANF